MKRPKKFAFIFVFAALLAFFLSSAMAPEIHSDKGHEKLSNTQKNTHKPFDPREMIMDHVLDSYEWHLFTYKKFYCSIPLPVILYSKDKGLNIFFSTKLHHGEKDYKSFKISKGGKYKGKVVEEMPDGTVVRPIDLSLTKVAVAFIFCAIFMLWLFISVAKSSKLRKDQAPHGLQNLMEPLIIFVRDEIAKSSIGEKYERYVPYLLTLFFFIFFNNLLGLIPIPPGGANVMGNIAIPIVLSFFTFALVIVSSTKYYWIDMFNTPGVPWWLKFPIPLLPLIEFSGLFIKHIVLVIRLFANILAGHTVSLGFFALIFIFGESSLLGGYGMSVLAILFTVFLALLEILVSLIQAYVFTLLSALYFGLALEEKHQ